MEKILLFAGTLEGRMLAEYLQEHQISTYVCVATKYGKELLPKGEWIQTAAGRLEMDDIEALIQKHDFDVVFDATHPFARMISENIQKACQKTGLDYIRIIREEEKGSKKGVWVNSIKEAIEYLGQTQGNILITTGSKDLKEYTKLKGYEERCYARVLPTLTVVQECVDLGIKGKHLICMQGPFEKEINLAILRQMKAAYLVTKESGSAGGFTEKLEAAMEADVTPIVIGRPIEMPGYSVAEAKKLLQKRYEIEAVEKRKVTLLGIGMGDRRLLTLEGSAALKHCQVIIGSKRVLEGLASFHKDSYTTIKNEEIISYIKGHSEYQRIVVAFSGDIGFYSGMKRLLPLLEECEVEIVCGIPSPIYFFSKLRISWNEVKLLSFHGRDCNIVKAVKKNKKVFALLGGEKSISDICRELMEHQLEDVTLTIGENLSYPNETFTRGTPKELLEKEFGKLAVLFIENPHYCKGENEVMTYGMPDEAFVRDKTPMTKSEVRSISISKLRLTKQSTLYDIGAGTGSISVEAARIVKEGKVVAIEMKEEAVKLIEANKEKFGIDNLRIIQGEATTCLRNLSGASHAFIGGTAGNLRSILEQLLWGNPSIRIVMNVIALETLAETMSLLKELPIRDVEIIQACIAKGKVVADYHLMMGQNPVYVISFSGMG